MITRVRFAEGFRASGTVRRPVGLSYLALLLGCTASAPGQEAAPSSTKNVAAIQDLLAGRTDTANAAWWGFDPADATYAVQSAIDSKARKVIIPNLEHDWIIRPVTLASNQEILFEPGVVVVAKEGDFLGTHDAMFKGVAVQNVRIIGYGATARMRKAEYVTPKYERSEWRHVLALHGVWNVEVAGLTLESSGGDGIYLGPTYDDRRLPCRNVTVRDCTCSDHFRQGISIVSGEHIRIENCILKDSRGTSPQAGIDVEPAHPRDSAVDIVITGCRAIGTAGSGFLVSLTRQTSESEPASVRVENCSVENAIAPGLRTVLRDEGNPRGLVEFVNCTVDTCYYAGAMMQWAASASVKLKFERCRWRNVAKPASDVPIYIELFGKPGAGQIEFIDCQVHDSHPRKPIRIVQTEAAENSAVSGVIHVFNPRFIAAGGVDKDKYTSLNLIYEK